jgi:hypothetical protein
LSDPFAAGGRLPVTGRDGPIGRDEAGLPPAAGFPDAGAGLPPDAGGLRAAWPPLPWAWPDGLLAAGLRAC